MVDGRCQGDQGLPKGTVSYVGSHLTGTGKRLGLNSLVFEPGISVVCRLGSMFTLNNGCYSLRCRVLLLVVMAAVRGRMLFF